MCGWGSLCVVFVVERECGGGVVVCGGGCVWARFAPYVGWSVGRWVRPFCCIFGAVVVVVGVVVVGFLVFRRYLVVGLSEVYRCWVKPARTKTPLFLVPRP